MNVAFPSHQRGFFHVQPFSPEQHHPHNIIAAPSIQQASPTGQSFVWFFIFASPLSFCHDDLKDLTKALFGNHSLLISLLLFELALYSSGTFSWSATRSIFCLLYISWGFAKSKLFFLFIFFFLAFFNIFVCLFLFSNESYSVSSLVNVVSRYFVRFTNQSSFIQHRIQILPSRLVAGFGERQEPRPSLLLLLRVGRACQTPQRIPYAWEKNDDITWAYILFDGPALCNQHRLDRVFFLVDSASKSLMEFWFRLLHQLEIRDRILSHDEMVTYKSYFLTRRTFCSGSFSPRPRPTGVRAAQPILLLHSYYMPAVWLDGCSTRRSPSLHIGSV